MRDDTNYVNTGVHNNKLGNDDGYNMDWDAIMEWKVKGNNGEDN